MPIALVTGSNGNLGKAVLEKFLQSKFRVIGTVSRSRAGDARPDLEILQADLSNEKETALLVSDILERYGAIDVAVLTAGGFAMADIAGTDGEELKKMYDLNFLTAYHVARPVFMAMKKTGKGRVFLVGSKPGLDTRNAKNMVAYSLSKSLLFRLAELMNMEAAGTEVTVSVVVPGTIDTPQNREAMPTADFNKWVTAEQIADVIYYYAGAEAAVIREPVIKVYNKS
jgi:NAD(P)-dependent dehydrogenase (short-subunit alcohol dehydrogenase family)